MTADEFGEGVFGAVAGVVLQQFQVAGVGGVAHFQKYIVADCGNPPKDFQLHSLGW